MRSILLNPGPVSLSEGVRRAAVNDDLCHRESEFYELQDGLRASLLDVYGLAPPEWSAVLLGGSGTTAMEAMVASLVPSDGAVLVIENGVYGERFTRLCEIHGIPHNAVHAEWGDEWDLQEIDSKLSTGGHSHVLAVHHETTTGRLNPVEELAAICERHHCGLLLDCVSSFGAEAIPFESPAVLACAVTANKCLHGITGLCFVICRSEALAAVDEPRTLTLHLPVWEKQQAQRSTPFTPSVNAMQALRQALVELEIQGGWKARHARYGSLAKWVASCLQARGIESLLPEAASSCVLRAYRLPEGMTYEQLHDGLKQRGFIVYAGQGGLAAEIFRISTMGDITDYDMQRLLGALETTIPVH